MQSNMGGFIEVTGTTKVFPKGIKAFKQLHSQKVLNISLQNPVINQLLRVAVKVEVIQTRVSSSPIGVSVEACVLTGGRLEVMGKIQYKIEYVSGDAQQTMNVVCFTTPFCIYIVLAEQFDKNCEFKATAYIEDIYVALLNERKIFISVMGVINAEPL